MSHRAADLDGRRHKADLSRPTPLVVMLAANKAIEKASEFAATAHVS
jgi:hypothetical protein